MRLLLAGAVGAGVDNGVEMSLTGVASGEDAEGAGGTDDGAEGADGGVRLKSGLKEGVLGEKGCRALRVVELKGLSPHPPPSLTGPFDGVPFGGVLVL